MVQIILLWSSRIIWRNLRFHTIKYMVRSLPFFSGQASSKYTYNIIQLHLSIQKTQPFWNWYNTNRLFHYNYTSYNMANSVWQGRQIAITVLSFNQRHDSLIQNVKSGYHRATSAHRKTVMDSKRNDRSYIGNLQFIKQLFPRSVNDSSVWYDSIKRRNIKRSIFQ